MYLFGYGSLMNERGLRERVPNARIVARATLDGYKRSFTKPGTHHLYLNIIPDPAMSIEGVVIEMTEEDLEHLKQFEPGYSLVDITSGMRGFAEKPVLSFIAPPYSPTHHRTIRRSYIEKCLAGVPEAQRSTWLAESEILEGVTIDETA